MNNLRTMIAFRDMTANHPRTEVQTLAHLARYEHVLFDGIMHGMQKGERSGIVKDFSLRKLWRWERVNGVDVYDIDVESDMGEGFAAMVLFSWGEIVHPANASKMICLDEWQQIIIDAILDGSQSGEIEDVYGVKWRWTTR